MVNDGSNGGLGPAGQNFARWKRSHFWVLWLQVKAAEHVVTGHQVAIKILNRRKIRSMDMDEKGAFP